ncbi:MAG TPA: phospho-N-acetylmuramoyl-pentapeptide-transferase [Candidatus Paceibacterota bacterium]|nr:phospho-N-acetylmuramoyl-pentapeptide-transferase [Candidatus Paceibacterota bacterium]
MAIAFNSITGQIIRLILLGTMALVGGFVLAPLTLKFLIKIKAGKQIRNDGDTPVYTNMHLYKAGTPTMGGIIIWGSVLLITIILAILSRTLDGFWGSLSFLSRAQTYLPLGAMLAAALIGLADDVLGFLHIGSKGGGLTMKRKILLYTLIAIIGAWWFYVKLQFDVVRIPFVGNFSLGVWYILYFIFILVAAAFSTNETDGLDGLAGGVLMVSFIAMMVVAFTEGRYDLAAFLVTIVGALVPFLWYNIFPAKFFMGDTGAMSLGIVLGVVAMLTNTSVLLPFFAFILVFESGSVIIQTLSKKIRHKKVFRSTPIHHHYEAVLKEQGMEYPETHITPRFWLVSGVMAAVGLMLYFLDRFLVK